MPNLRPSGPTYRDRHGRIWPSETVYRYQRDADFWRDYAAKLEDLAGTYERLGLHVSAATTRGDAADLRAVLALR